MTEEREPAPAQAIDAIARQWQKSTILNPTMLEQLYEINRIYLDMLASVPRPTAAVAGNPETPVAPDPVTASLMELKPEQRSLVARCPFSLFNAKFQNGTYWTALANTVGMVREATPALALVEDKRAPLREQQAAFAEMALFYAWHLVRSHALAAQLLLGMKSQTLSVFKQMSLARLRQLILDKPELITPRWPDRTRFWKVLVVAAQQGAEERISEMRLLGIQMIAAELAAPAGPEVRTRPPVVS